MNQEQQPTQFDRSPEFFVAEVAHRWLSGIDRTIGDAETHVDKLQKIDPEKGLLHEMLQIRVTRKMEKVEDSPTVKVENPLLD